MLKEKTIDESDLDIFRLVDSRRKPWHHQEKGCHLIMQLDESSFQGIEIDLSPKEKELLRVFIRELRSWNKRIESDRCFIHPAHHG